MIVHKFDDDIIIYPICDVHFGALEHNASAWNAFCKELLSLPNAYIALGGDLINNATRSSISNIFEETIRPRDQKRIMAEMLESVKDRILCAIPGNHERRSVKDADDEPIYDIMCKLNLEDLYRPNAAFLKIQLGKRHSQNKAMTTYVGCVTHGAGGGIYTGTSVNRNERFANVIEGLDFMIAGHTHKGTVTKPAKLVVDPQHNKVLTKSCTVITATPWQKYGGYAMRGMLLPATDSEPQKLMLKHVDYHKKKKIDVIW